MKSSWWTRYIHIHRVSKGVCPCCENKDGEYSTRELPHHFWLYFSCKSCGYELREHVMREKMDGAAEDRTREGEEMMDNDKLRVEVAAPRIADVLESISEIRRSRACAPSLGSMATK